MANQFVWLMFGDKLSEVCCNCNHINASRYLDWKIMTWLPADDYFP